MLLSFSNSNTHTRKNCSYLFILTDVKKKILLFCYIRGGKKNVLISLIVAWRENCLKENRIWNFILFWLETILLINNHLHLCTTCRLHRHRFQSFLENSFVPHRLVRYSQIKATGLPLFHMHSTHKKCIFTKSIDLCNSNELTAKVFIIMTINDDIKKIFFLWKRILYLFHIQKLHFLIKK